MTEAEIREWAGMKPDMPVRLRVILALKSVSVPKTDAEHVAVFRIWLAASAVSV